MYAQERNQNLSKNEGQVNKEIVLNNYDPININVVQGHKDSNREFESRSKALKSRCQKLINEDQAGDLNIRLEPALRQNEQDLKNEYKNCIQELLDLNQELLQNLDAGKVREQAYQALINSTEELILLLDDAGKILVANNAFIQSLDLDPELIQEKTITELVPHIARVCRREIKNLQQSGDEVFFNCWHGSELYEVRVYPVYGPNGVLLHRALFSNNVTQKIREAEALSVSNRRLQELTLNIFDTLESERKKIAQELHDYVGQSLGAIKYSIESLLQYYNEVVSKSQEQHFSGIIRWIQVTIKELMRIISDLRPPMLDELGFKYTIDWFCRQYDEFYPDLSVESEVDLQGQDIEEPVKTILFRVVQEAFNNTVNHSQANKVRLYVGRENAWIYFSVTDNGIGFDPKEVLADSIKPGFGLLGIKERIANLGGQVEFNSLPNKGVVIQGYLPEELANQV